MSDIPNGEILFKYVSPVALPDDQEDLPVSLFYEKNMSCDWKKYKENPFTSFHIKEGKTIVIAINIRNEIRYPTNPKNKGLHEKSWRQEIIHDPVAEEQDPSHGENFAHSLIRGRKRLPVQEIIRDNASIFEIK